MCRRHEPLRGHESLKPPEKLITQYRLKRQKKE